VEQNTPQGGQAVLPTSDGLPAPSELTNTPEGQQQEAFDPAEIAQLRAQAERAAQLEAEQAQMRQRMQAYDAQLGQQAAQAWKAEEQRMLQQAQQMDDPTEAARFVAAQYQARENALVEMVRQRDQQAHVQNLNAWVDQNVREHGLTDADRYRLAAVAAQNPDAVPQEAARIKAERATPSAEIAALKQQVEQLTRAQAAGQIVQSGAWQTGGANTQPATDNPNPRQQLRRLLAGTAGIPG